MHYYRFSIGDYARSTRHLSNDEDLAYRRLIDMYYENEGPIPLETHWVARRIRMDTEIVQAVLDDMFERTDDGYRQHRCDTEIADYQKQAERNRANGQRGGRPKTVKNQPTQNPLGYESDASGNPVVTLTTNHKPKTKNQEPITPPSPPRGFAKPDDVSEQIWNDFLAIRKSKKAPLTESAVQGIRREAQKAGWSLEDALRECCVRGWQGFKADWVEGRGRAKGIGI
jgi:uncharacterized protein YdaU (DUF1376 family)